MNNKRFFKPLFKTMLFFAILHIALLTVLFVLSLRLSYLNIFSIVGLSEFFPGIEKGAMSFIVSVVIILVVYAVFYAKQKQKK